MHHLYPSVKGDPLCPLGFHPQVRWPTRCKRCFRDYKEHGNRKEDRLRKDETTVSSPTLSSWSSPSSRREESRIGSTSDMSPRSWATGAVSSTPSSPPSSSTSSSSSSSSTSTSRTTQPNEALVSSQSSKFSSSRPASSWTSTPDLGKLTADTQAEVTTVSLTLPRRRAVPIEDPIETQTIVRRRVIERSPPRDRSTTATTTTTTLSSSTPSNSQPSLSTTSTFTSRRAREAKEAAKEAADKADKAVKDTATSKLRRVQIQSLKEVKSTEKDESEVEFVLQVKSSKSNSKPVAKLPTATTKKMAPASTLTVPSTGSSSSSGSGNSSEESYEDDSDDDATSIAGTETTETDTLIDRNENELQEQIDSLKQELDTMRTKCDRVEREKSDILLRRLAAMDTAPSKTAASEVLKLQQRVNEFLAQTEDLKDEKKVLTLRVKELEEELEQRPDAAATKKVVDELRSKLLAAETLCEELMDENEDMKKELRDLEEEIEEMQDNFREDQADEYTTLRKELEQTAKNCRILSFKLRKAERKIEQVEAEKLDAEKRVGGGPGLERMKLLEQEVAVANEVAKRLQKELEESNDRLKSTDPTSPTKDDSKGKKKPPMLGVIGKTSSGEKISRESLTRGGSQEDPVQLLRDLQDSMEREADLREQLRYAEEELKRRHKPKIFVRDNFLPQPAWPGLEPAGHRLASLPYSTLKPMFTLDASLKPVNPSKPDMVSTAIQTLSQKDLENMFELSSESRPVILKNIDSVNDGDVAQNHAVEDRMEGCELIMKTVKTLESAVQTMQEEMKEFSTVCLQTENEECFKRNIRNHANDMDEQTQTVEAIILDVQTTHSEVYERIKGLRASLVDLGVSSDHDGNYIQKISRHYPSRVVTQEITSDIDALILTESMTKCTQTENCDPENHVTQSTQTEIDNGEDISLPNSRQGDFQIKNSDIEEVIMTEHVTISTQRSDPESNLTQSTRTEIDHGEEIMAPNSSKAETQGAISEIKIVVIENVSMSTQTETGDTETYSSLSTQTEYEEDEEDEEDEEEGACVQIAKGVTSDIETQTEIHWAMPSAISSMRQVQFSMSAMFPPGDLGISPLGSLFAPLGRRHSPSPARLTPEPPVDKDEGISDEEDPAELRLLLELNEQEASVLRRKMEDMEKEGDIMKRKMKDLQDKLNVKSNRKSFSLSSSLSDSGKSSPLQEQKLKVMEEELSEVRKKLIEKERDCERLNSELTLTQKRFSKGAITKSKSLDLGNDQQAIDLKRQLQVIEQEASILRSRTQTLEADNEKISSENKRLQMYRGPKKLPASKESGETSGTAKELQDKVTALQAQLTEATNKVNELKGQLEEQENELNDPKKKGLGLKETVELTKLKKEVKVKTDELDKLKLQVSKQDGEFEKINEVLKRIKEDSVANAVKFYKARTPKKPTDFTTKLQMKKMVEDLESEIAEVLAVLKKTETDKVKLDTDTKSSKDAAEDLVFKAAKEKLEQDLEASRKTLEALTKELKDEREKVEKDKTKALKDKKLVEENAKKLEENSRKMDEEKVKWEVKVKKVEEEKAKVEAEKNKIVEEINQMKYDKVKMGLDMEKISAEKAVAVAKQDELPVLIHKIECLKNDLEEERRQGASFRKQMEALQKAEVERNKLQKDLAEKTKKLVELEKLLKDTETKAKKFELTTTSNKTKISGLEKQLTEEREKIRVSDEMSTNWLAERDGLKEKIDELSSKTKAMEADLVAKNNQIQTLEGSVREERERATDASVKAGSAEKREITKLREELDTSNAQIKDLADKLDKIDKSSKANEEKYKKTETELNKANNDLQSKASELEMDLQAERKKSERIKATQEKETKNKEQELSSLKTKLRAMETSSVSTRKVTDAQKDYETNLEKIEAQLSAERHAYEDLTTKYEILEEEHVVTKAQLVMDKEAIQKQLQSAKREHTSTENDLRALRETYNDKQDTWIKEKLNLQERLKELEERGSRNDENAATRLKNMVESKTGEVEKLKKESEVISDQMDYMRKENDELRRKLEDFDKVVKIHRNMTADTSAIDKELQETKNKLFQEEKSRKAEVAQLKLRYDGRVALIGEEIQSLQAQVGRFKRERDTFRHMLEGAQKTISDLKASPSKGKDNRTSTSSNEESEETRTKLATLDQQISCMEDELSEARLEASKLKTELVSERSSWEVKMSEMQSRVNELEEERIVASGRSKIPGMRTRMELAWQKERDEQHRLLQETSTLARDLRQTLFEVERERDKERLEAKRRHDQLKKTTEEEQDENRKKVTEIQCDLLELRDAHAKLRTTNEKLRREKERNEKEREDLRQLVAGKKRAEADEERKVNTMLEQIDELMRLAPDLFPHKQDASENIATPTPPRRLKGPKSRESSPSLERKEFRKESSVDRQFQLQSTVQRLADATDELRKYQRLSEEERDKERARRTLGMRRAASTEADNPPENTLRPKALNGKGVQRKGSLYRKSLSLEQTSGSGPQDQQIWKNDDETDGSLTSLQSLDAGSEAMIDSRYFSLPRRETSVDSRLSGGSTQSEVIQSGEKKKKKGILGKLKKLTKSRSIDDTNTATDYPMSVGQGSGSDISVAADDKGSKKDLRDRLTGIFKKSGSRSSSVERSKKEESPALPDRTALSTQRPLVRAGTATTSSNAIQRPSPARSDSSQTSSSSRPLAPKKTIGGLLPLPSSTLRRTK